MAAQTLNAQQIAAVNERFNQHVSQVIDQLKLRRWAAEMALAEKGNPDPVALAQKLYDFVVNGLFDEEKKD